MYILHILYGYSTIALLKFKTFIYNTAINDIRVEKLFLIHYLYNFVKNEEIKKCIKNPTKNFTIKIIF